MTARKDDEVYFDADVDVVVYGEQGILILRNDKTGNGRELVPVAQPDLTELGDVSQAILVDFDHDSDLDLVLICQSQVRALLNQGNAKSFCLRPQSLCRVKHCLPVARKRLAELPRPIYLLGHHVQHLPERNEGDEARAKPFVLSSCL